MTTKEQKIERVEYSKIYVANDGTEFRNEEECRKYEKTASCAINGMFRKLKFQETCYIGDGEPFGLFGYEDTLYAVEIENTDQLEIVNKWICDNDSYSCCEKQLIGADKIGTIQLICLYDGGVFTVGTPEELKEKYCKAIDELYNKLIEKAEEPKEEND